MDESCVVETRNEMGEGGGFKSFVAGGIGGMALIVVGQPLDLLKVKIQTAPEKLTFFNSIRQVYSQQGLLGFYKGMSVPFVGITPIIGLSFWGFELGKKLYSELPHEMIGATRLDIHNLPVSGIAFAGAFSALPASFLVIPGERIKILLQAQVGREASSDRTRSASRGYYPYFNGPLDCVKKITLSEGIRYGLYRGTSITMARELLSCTVYYGGYELIKRQILSIYQQQVRVNDTQLQLNLPAVILAGGLAGGLNACVVLPLDTLKSMLQVAPLATYPRGTRQIISDIVRPQGLNVLFRGFLPIVLRAFPANAACFLSIEYSKALLNRYF